MAVMTWWLDGGAAAAEAKDCDVSALGWVRGNSCRGRGKFIPHQVRK